MVDRSFLLIIFRSTCSLIYARTFWDTLYPLETSIGGVEQTQTSNKPKVRTNLNFEQTQTSNIFKF